MIKKILKEVEVSDKLKLSLFIDEWSGEDWVCLRFFSKHKDGKWHLTNKGLNLKPELAKEFFNKDLLG